MANKWIAGLAKNSANFQPLSPLGFLARSALIYPERIAVIDRQRRHTYREFYTRCRRLASSLQKAGVEVGDTVSFMAANCEPLLCAHFATDWPLPP